MNTLLLLVLALLPGVLLLVFILFMDRNEKEPLGMVLKMIVFGALSAIPVVIIEKGLSYLPIYGGSQLWQAFAISFIQVAPVEEFAKLAVVLLFAWKSSHFGEENDGIVYVGSAALGFAMLENVSYVLSLGMIAGISRSVTAMPLHCFTGVLMGYYLGKARFKSDPVSRKRTIIKGFIWAVLVHGLYDTFLFTRTSAAFLILPLVIILVIFGIRVMKKGRALSIARSSGQLEAMEDEVPGEIKTGPRSKQIWKAIVGRILLGICVIFWALLMPEILSPSDLPEIGSFDLIIGGLVITFIPIIIGLILEVSYRRNKKRLRNQ